MELNLRARKKLSGFSLATEMISFQHDKFGAEIEEIITKIYEFCDKNRSLSYNELGQFISNDSLVRLLEDLIFKRTGIKTRIYSKGNIGGAINVMLFNEHHILLPDFLRGQVSKYLQDQAALIEKSTGKKGTVDLEKARVSGIFSEYEHEIYIPFHLNYLYANFTPAEQTAILLHEIGHAFTYYEFSDRLETTNQVMANLSKVMKDSSANTEKRVYCLRELEECFGLKEKTLDELADEKSYTIFGLKLFKRYMEFVHSQVPNELYNQTASEQLADNFATRFGYGRPLVTGLDKFEKLCINDAHKKPSIFLAWLSLIWTMGWIFICSLYIVGTAVYALVYMAMFVTVVLLGSGTAGRDYTYDTTKARFKRIRQQFIEQIKTTDMDKKSLAKHITNIHEIDRVINSVFEEKLPLEKIANFIFPHNRKAEDSLDAQYLLEDLAHNNLFLKSAEMKVLA